MTANSEPVMPAATSKARRASIDEAPSITPQASDVQAASGDQNQLPAATKSWLRRMYDYYVGQGWAFEIVCMLFSFTTFWIIFTLIIYARGRELSSWKLGMSIDSVVSILSGLAKAAILLATVEALGQLKWSWVKKNPEKLANFEMFDLASRGPWGSFWLLFRTRGR
jgi:hypothetical protein